MSNISDVGIAKRVMVRELLRDDVMIKKGSTYALYLKPRLATRSKARDVSKP